MARLRYDGKVPEWRKNMSESGKAVQRAATTAVTKTATLARDNARQNISGAGFSSRWQKAMRFSMEKNPPDTFAAADVFHGIPFAVIFEEGATIRGKPKLWLPIEANLPPGKWTPQKYVARFGPLVSVNRPGKPPLLFLKNVATRRDAASIKRRAALGLTDANTIKKPLFVGVDAVTIRKRFAIYEAIREAASHIGEFYDEAMRAEGQ